MTILHIRIDAPGFSSDPIEKAFVSHGVSYYGFNWQNARFEMGTEMMRSMIIALVDKLKPDVIFSHVQNQEAIDLETYRELAKRAFVIQFTFDVRTLDKTTWMYDVAGIVGHSFFACKEDVFQCFNRNIYNASNIHSSCDMELFKPTPGKKDYSYGVVFCGNRYDNTNLDFPLAGERQKIIRELETTYGSKFIAFGLGQTGGMIMPAVENTVYNHCKIAINQNNFKLRDYTSDRLWRIMASGTFCLTKYFPGIERIFGKGEHLDWFSDTEEMKSLIDYYLANEDERLEIAEAGCELVRRDHTWENRISEILSVVPVEKMKYI